MPRSLNIISYLGVVVVYILLHRLLVYQHLDDVGVDILYLANSLKGIFSPARFSSTAIDHSVKTYILKEVQVESYQNYMVSRS